LVLYKTSARYLNYRVVKNIIATISFSLSVIVKKEKLFNRWGVNDSLCRKPLKKDTIFLRWIFTRGFH